MSVHLLDVNVLIALSWPSHIHHSSAHRWFSEERGDGFATCPMTQCGFIRISANSLIIPDAVSVPKARDHLRLLMAHPDHVFWNDDVNPCEKDGLPAALMGGHRQVTDAYLVALACRRRGKLVTLDQRIPKALKNSRFAESVVLIALD